MISKEYTRSSKNLPDVIKTSTKVLANLDLNDVLITL